MATLLEYAELADAAYGTPSAIAWLKANNWVQLPGSIGPTTDSADNYQGVAYQNSATKEIVIANRGTVPTSFNNLWSDAQLAVHQPPSAVRDAITFANIVARSQYAQSGAQITEVGHSLGGYEAQAAVAALVDGGVDTTASAVTFQAPGISSGLFHRLIRETETIKK
jgi:hypothetical protein